MEKIQIFHVTFEEAKIILLTDGRDGAHLVRQSSSVDGALVLCYCDAGEVKQVRVLKSIEGLFYLRSESQDPALPSKHHTCIEDLLNEVKLEGRASAINCQLTRYISFECSQSKTSETRNNLPVRALQRPTFQSKRGSSSSTAFIRPERTWLTQLQRADLSRFSGEMLTSVNDYVLHGWRDDYNLLQENTSNTVPLHFSSMMKFFRKELCRAIREYHHNVSTLKRIFCDDQTDTAVISDEADVTMWEEMQQCKKIHDQVSASVMSYLLKRKTTPTTEISGLDADGYSTIPDFVDKETSGVSADLGPKPIPFEVKQETGLFTRRLLLVCHIQEGHCIVYKLSDGIRELEFVPDDVEQIINSSSNQHKLRLRLTSQSLALIFLSSQARAAFCRTIQYMKSLHSSSVSVEDLSLFVGTWNMGNSSNLGSLRSWLTGRGEGNEREPSLRGQPCDMYVIGCQEAQIPEKDFGDRLLNQLTILFTMDTFFIVSSQSLWGLRLVIIVRKTHRHLVTNCVVSSVRTGFGAILANKGCVATSVSVSSLRLLFICAHLPARTDRLQRRIENFQVIMKGLSSILSGQHDSSVFDLSSLHHHIFWLGDLNFRSNTGHEECVKLVSDGKLTELLQYDQLSDIRRKDLAFFKYDEADITFRPTYKFAKGRRDIYDCIKQKPSSIVINTPSWTDRILCKSLNSKLIQSKSYGACSDITVSDHSPVFAVYDVHLPPLDLSFFASKSRTSETQIIFQLHALKLPSCTRRKGSLHVAVPGYLHAEKVEIMLHDTGWSTEESQVRLRLTACDPELLAEAFFVISANDSESSFGSAAVPLEQFVYGKWKTVSEHLIHHGSPEAQITFSIEINIHDWKPKRKLSKKLVAWDGHDMVENTPSDHTDLQSSKAEGASEDVNPHSYEFLSMSSSGKGKIAVSLTDTIDVDQSDISSEMFQVDGAEASRNEGKFSRCDSAVLLARDDQSDEVTVNITTNTSTSQFVKHDSCPPPLPPKLSPSRTFPGSLQSLDFQEILPAELTSLQSKPRTKPPVPAPRERSRITDE